VPELNVLTVEVKSQAFNTDSALGNLTVGACENGKQVFVKELQ
jgi:hypothetical protein